MPNITVRTLEGEEHKLEAENGASLMEPLRDAGLIDATCGGMASCGTCHVYLSAGWTEKCGDRTEDEGYMLEGLEDFVDVKSNSRLCCQITLSDDHDGIDMDLAPEA